MVVKPCRLFHTHAYMGALINQNEQRFSVKHTAATFALLNNTALLDAVVVVRVVVVVGSAP